MGWEQEYEHDCSNELPLPPPKYQANTYNNAAGRESNESTLNNSPGRNSTNSQYQEPKAVRHQSGRRNEKQHNTGSRQNRANIENRAKHNSSLRNLPICKKCSRPVYDESDGFEIEAIGGWFHPNCFTCSQCNCLFDDNRPFVPHRGNAYCEQHYEMLFLPNCEAWYSNLTSKGPITDGKISTAFGRSFHPNHLRVIQTDFSAAFASKRFKDLMLSIMGKYFVKEISIH